VIASYKSERQVIVRKILLLNFPSFIFRGFSSWRTPKFSLINYLTNTFLYIVSFNFLCQAVQKGPFSISGLVHIRFFFALASFS